MDPFTQRMLERAKIRREKLDNHFSKKNDLEKRSPLKESNVESRKKPFEDENTFDGGNEIENKGERQSYVTSSRKSKLQKLAQFYSGNTNSNNENVFLENEKLPDPIVSANNVERKHQPKLGRLAELATKIKEWEDDLDHPKHFIAINENKVVNHNKDLQEGVFKNKKQTLWDNAMVEKLGFSLAENHSKLTYDFEENDGVKKILHPEKCAKETSKKNVDVKSSSSCGEHLRKGVLQKNGEGNKNAVLKKAAFFEMDKINEAPKRNKDPAELSLAERRALFERNKDTEIIFKSRATVKDTSLNACGAVAKECTNAANLQKLILSEKRENAANETLELSCIKTKSKRQTENVQIEKDENNEETERSARNSVILSKDSPLNPKEDKGVRILNSALIRENSFTREEMNEVPQPPPLPKAYGVTSELQDSQDLKSDTELNGKCGRLYPSLSNLDVMDESEHSLSEMESLNESKNSNLYLNMTLTDLLEINKNNPITPPSDGSFSGSKECQVLNKMDKLLENVLNDISDSENEDDYPSPPKIKKNSSFEYKSNEDNTPLLHTVSFYRKQHQNLNSTTEKVVCEEERNAEKAEDEGILVQSKIETLLAEVNKQQTIISQASQALNLCISTVEFSGSGEQVEGERLLLLASHKRQACLNEIQRLKVENSMRPEGNNNILTERGDVVLRNISIKLKRDALRAMAAAENLQYFVCLIKSDERVLATPVVSATRDNLKDMVVQFPGQIKLEGLLSDFKITVEVYNLELNKELLPHNVKYHINNKKEKKLLTPIKSKKSESKLVKPHLQSPAGPNAVRTSNFQLCGYIVFSLREVTRTQWILNKVPYISPLEGSISMTIQSQLRLDDEFKGFLTMFDDISGFGAWHRRWCLLSSHVISYWKYPDDEYKKIPIGTIDLKSVVTENVGLVSRDICARLHTFLLETTRPRLCEDQNSLVLHVQENVTTIRHLLSADSKQEMMAWCKKINTILALLRSWKCNFDG